MMSEESGKNYVLFSSRQNPDANIANYYAKFQCSLFRNGSNATNGSYSFLEDLQN